MEWLEEFLALTDYNEMKKEGQLSDSGYFDSSMHNF
jgi:hypothetical protein